MKTGRRRSGFSLVELALVLSILVIVSPLVWITVRRVEGRADDALWRLQIADSAGTVAGSIALDGRRGRSQPDALVWQLDGCRVRYRVDDGALWRAGEGGCQAEQVLARDVQALDREEGGLRLVFARSVRQGEEQRVEFFLPEVSP